MLFINPMWDNEAERIGKQRCTPIGYVIHIVSDLIGFAGLLALLGSVVFLVWRGIAGTFQIGLLWLLVIPLLLGVAGNLLFALSWSLARKRGFEYDGETRTASWQEDGERRTYKYQHLKTEASRAGDG